MDSDAAALDCAQFQLSPRRSRCELIVWGGGRREKLASGLVKPFLSHLKVAEEQAANGGDVIRLEVERRRNNADGWFNKGTLERFVRFVSTPEVLELVNTFDAEMSQLEGARKIYSQGGGDQLSGGLGENKRAAAAAADVTKKELLKAIDVRFATVKQDLATACARASAAGFTLDTVSELLLFADRFGALRLNEACTKFISLCQQRPELMNHQQSSQPLLPAQLKGFDDANIRSSSGSDMSIDEEVEPNGRSKPYTKFTDNIGPSKPYTKFIDSIGPSLHRLSGGQLPQKTTAEPKPSTRPSMEDSDKATEDSIASAELPTEAPQPVGGGSRRLSVQDRIHLFESKQKEQSGSATTSSSGGAISKVMAGKGEHRRLPSDVSVEKSVLRRWSGASDMSIDLNNNNSSSSDRKESGGAAGMQIPISSANSQVQSGSKTEEDIGGLKDTAASQPYFGPSDTQTSAFSSSSLTLPQPQTRSFPEDKDRTEDVMLKDGTTDTSSKSQLGPSMEGKGDFPTEFSVSLGRAQVGRSSVQTASQNRSKPISDSIEGDVFRDQAASLNQSKTISEQNVKLKDQAASQIPSIVVPVISEDQSGENIAGLKSQATSMTKFRRFVGKAEDAELKLPFKASSDKVEEIAPKSDLPSEFQRKTFPGKQEEVARKGATASQMSFKASSVEVNSRPQGMKVHGRTAAPEQLRKLQGKGDERLPHEGSVGSVFAGKKAKEGFEVLNQTSTLMEPVQVVRPLKGNNELNDELQMKANELEKLFAIHKNRVHGEQTSSSRRSKPVDDHTPMSIEKRHPEARSDQILEGNPQRGSSTSNSGREFDTNSLLKIGDALDSGNGMKQKLGNLGPSDELRGSLYEKYMQKRDAKLREEWSLKRVQKEAKMKAMHDSLERSQAEMKVKFSASADKQDAALACRRAEKMRTFNFHSAIKSKEQMLDSLDGEEEENPQEPSGQVHYGQDALSGNESSSSIHSKKFVSSRILSSSPRTLVAPIPKSSTKSVNSGSIRRRAQPENLLAQSVPNFSDFRKENTKPSSGHSKVTSRVQSGAFVRSKSTIEEANLAKEEKSRRSHSMRKSSVNQGELKDLSPLSSDAANLTTLKSAKEQTEQVLTKIYKSGDSKPFLRKGNGIGPGSGAGVAKLKASMIPDILKDEDESEVLMDEREDSLDAVKDDDEEFERRSAERNIQETDMPVNSDSESDSPGSENGDVLRSLSQVDDDSTAVSPKLISSAGHVQESPGESPGSWNSNMHHSFSYAQEASDVEASVDSPTGSPASWNSHPLNQMMEADAARMRKKWGSAQIPVLVANASHQSRKDVTKGFKRLLKFGRKSKGSDYLINDWVSASTASEGDDDTEDGRDQATRSSDDLRKSRMGYSAASYDGFNESDAFPVQVQSLRSSIPNVPANFKLREDQLSGSSLKAPRSFFSLSSFRSKGSESKPR